MENKQVTHHHSMVVMLEWDSAADQSDDLSALAAVQDRVRSLDVQVSHYPEGGIEVRDREIAELRSRLNDTEPETQSWLPPVLKPLDIPLGLLGAVNHVYLFHEKLGIPWLDEPCWPGYARARLRWRLMSEEREEKQSAWQALEDLVMASVTKCADNPSLRPLLAQLAQELVDEIYTIIGTAGEFGLDLSAVWKVVHDANMQKEPGPDGGKAIKPEGWEPPDVMGALFGSPSK